MNENELKSYQQLFDAYKKSQMIAYGSPDQFQYHQNQLCRTMAEFLLTPFINHLKEAEKNKANEINEKNV